jgi:hypothetical protein
VPISSLDPINKLKLHRTPKNKPNNAAQIGKSRQFRIRSAKPPDRLVALILFQTLKKVSLQGLIPTDNSGVDPFIESMTLQVPRPRRAFYVRDPETACSQRDLVLENLPKRMSRHLHRLHSNQANILRGCRANPTADHSANLGASTQHPV